MGWIVVLLVPWIAALCLARNPITIAPNGRNYAGDIAQFLAGAEVVRAGGNPYDKALVERTDRAMLLREHVTPPADARYGRMGMPPIFLWVLQPLARLPFTTAARLWVLAMFGFAAAGFVALIWAFGWELGPVAVAAGAVFLSFPQVSGALGTWDPLLFLSLALGIALGRHRSGAAGVALSLTWIKVPVALPLALVVMAFHVRDPKRALAGFAAGTLAFVALTAVTTGWHSLLDWTSSLVAFSRNTRSENLDLATLAGLYVNTMSYRLRVALQALTLLAAFFASAFMWLRRRRDRPEVAPFAALWFVWFLAALYAHPQDEIELAIPVLALLGPNACDVNRAPQIALLSVALLSVWIGLPEPGGAVLLCLPVVLAGICAVLAARIQARPPEPVG